MSVDRHDFQPDGLCMMMERDKNPRGLSAFMDAAAGLEVEHYFGTPSTVPDFDRLRGRALEVLPEAAEWPLTFDVEARQRQDSEHGGRWWRRKRSR